MAEKTEERALDTSFVKADVIAKLFGLSVRRVQQLTQEGIIETTQTTQGRRYDLENTVKKYIQHLSSKAYGRADSEAEGQLKLQKLKADIALKESQGELHKLRTEIATGKYISLEEIKVDYERFFIIFKKFALGIPSRLSGRLAGYVDPVEVRQIENDLQNDINKVLRDFVGSAVVEIPESEVEKPKAKKPRAKKGTSAKKK